MPDLPPDRIRYEHLAGVVSNLVRKSAQFKWFGGPLQLEFESSFARFVGHDHGVMTSSGTSALQAALLAAGVGPGTVVALPSFAYHVTLSTVLHLGATPFLLRVDGRTLSVDLTALVEETPRDAVLLVVHATGRGVDVRYIAEERPDLVIVEDCADAQTTLTNGEPVGGIGAAAVWSFTTSHNVVHTASAAGMITTQQKNLADRYRRIVHYGKDDRSLNRFAGVNPIPAEPGFNGMSSEFEAAYGLETLRGAADAWADRRKIGMQLELALQDNGLEIVPEPSNSRQNYYDVLFRLTPAWTAVEQRALELGYGEGCALWSYHFLTALPWAEERLRERGGWGEREESIAKANAEFGPVMAIAPTMSSAAVMETAAAISKVFVDDSF